MIGRYTIHGLFGYSCRVGVPQKSPANIQVLGTIPSLKLTIRTWKWMVGRRLFPFGARPIFRCEHVSCRECTNFCPAIFVGNSWTTPSFRRDDPIVGDFFQVCVVSQLDWSMIYDVIESYLFMDVIWCYLEPYENKKYLTNSGSTCKCRIDIFLHVEKRQFESTQMLVQIDRLESSADSARKSWFSLTRIWDLRLLAAKTHWDWWDWSRTPYKTGPY